jgi:hypothetical protein
MKRSIVFGAYSSIGGFPLEEASAHERIPSIIGSIVWCFPTSTVLVIINDICILFLVSLVVIIFVNIWYLTRYLGYVVYSLHNLSIRFVVTSCGISLSWKIEQLQTHQRK